MQSSKSAAPLNTFLKLFIKVTLITWVIVWLIFWKDAASGNGLWKSFLNGVLSGILFTGCSFIGDFTDRYFNWLDDTIKKLISVTFLTFVLVFATMSVLFLIWNLPSNGIDFGVFKRLSLDDYKNTLVITAFISLFVYGKSFLQAWKDAALEAEVLKKEQAEARFETLKHQTNPHFLFNSLNVLTTLVHKDADLAEDFVRKLSSVYRYVLDHRNKEVVSIKTELEAIKAYDHLMKVRFANGYHLEIDIQDMEQVIPPLTLQLLVENALKHNTASQKRPLSIQIEEKDGQIRVSNNIQKVTIQKDSTGIGLPNIVDRYAYLNDKPVEIDQTADTFTVSLPILHKI